MEYIYQGPERECYTPGQSYSLMTQHFTGRKYADLNDKEGVKDNRIMVWKRAQQADLIVLKDQLNFEENFKRA